jgi:hypothetical protein
MSHTIEYRSVILPGVGRVKVPAHLSDEEVLAQINAPDQEATPKKKTKKKP